MILDIVHNSQALHKQHAMLQLTVGHPLVAPHIVTASVAQQEEHAWKQQSADALRFLSYLSMRLNSSTLLIKLGLTFKKVC